MDVTGTYQVAGLERLYEYGSRNLRRAAILALGMIGDYPTRNVLSRALHDTDRAVRMLAEDALPDIWARAGNAHQQHQLAQLTAYNSGGGYMDALRLAENMLRVAPEYAECWYQLGIAQFGLNRTRPAFEAFSQAFHGNATQFRAASSLGYCALRLDEPQAALGYFQAALGIHPGLEHVRLCIARLEKSLKY